MWAAILGWLETSFLKALIDKGWSLLSSFVASQKRAASDHSTAVNQAAQDSKPAETLPPTATVQETDNAIDSELNHL